MTFFSCRDLYILHLLPQKTAQDCIKHDDRIYSASAVPWILETSLCTFAEKLLSSLSPFYRWICERVKGQPAKLADRNGSPKETLCVEKDGIIGDHNSKDPNQNTCH